MCRQTSKIYLAYIPYQDPDSGITERFGVYRDLTAGIYTIWEERSPQGYIKIDDVYVFEVIRVENPPGSGEHENIISWIRKYDNQAAAVLDINHTGGTLLYDYQNPVTPSDPPEILDLNYNGTQIIGLQVVNEMRIIELNKVDGDANPLEGALFGLYRVDETSGTPHTLSDGTSVKLRPALNYGTNTPVQATSDASGLVRFENIPAGATFYVIEETPPTGFAPLEFPIGPFVSTDGGFDSTLGLASPYTVVNLAIISVTINKEWVGGLPETPIKVEFQLQRRPVGSDDSVPFVDVGGSIISIKSDSPEQTYTWTGLSPEYEYYVKEVTELPGYHIGDAVADPEDPNSFTITNTKVEYPETGGIGTLPYFMVGLCLIYLAFNIRKRFDEGGDLLM